MSPLQDPLLALHARLPPHTPLTMFELFKFLFNNKYTHLNWIDHKSDQGFPTLSGTMIEPNLGPS